MKTINTNFSGEIVRTHFNTPFSFIKEIYTTENIILLTDETVFHLHENRFEGFKVIVVDGSEKNKTQSTIDYIVDKLLEFNVDKSWLLVGVGGGVITDMAGYTASIFKRGIKLGLVPTTILAMTDAAIGGKNGVNVGMYKNMVGTTYRASFILYDYSFLATLPRAEFINGFAEIIKHACIKDEEMFNDLEKHTIEYFLNDREALASLIEKNVAIKTDVVVADEFEKADRFQLNFGHTFGHAIENLYNLPHGHAVSVGMVIAAKISEEINNFDSEAVLRLKKLLLQYDLPIAQKIDNAQVLHLLAKDKKRIGGAINFVLLNHIGEGSVQQISFQNIESLLDQTYNEG